MQIRRTIGQRTIRPAGELRPPTQAERRWVRQMAQYRTRVPKGVFRYRSMAEANADWNQWCAELLAEVAETDAKVKPDQRSN